MRTPRDWLLILLPLLAVAGGCAKYNTYFNAKRSFDAAENVREEALRKNQDPPPPTGAQRTSYETAIRKSQKILDEYPGHSLTDDVLFLQGKAHHRLESYRQSIRQFNLLFQNYPGTPYLEEALYLQALNYLLIGDLATSQDYLDRLGRKYPGSKFQAETRKVSGDNAFTLQKWEEAAESYRAYLDGDGEIQERDRIGLKLAQCYWELKQYYPAAEVLQEVSQEATSAELGFKARLLRARVHVHMQDYEIVKLLVDELRSEAEVYQASGDVALVEAEALIAQGKADEAAPLIESMPAEWLTPSVKARAGEILGNIYVERGEWEKARPEYQAALLRKDELDDEDRVRRLNDSLQDFMAAEQALPDAKGNRVARLKLLQANAMLFGFDRPRAAVGLYDQAAADTAADSTVAARALYGAYITYGEQLDQPDSARIYRDRLEDRFPDSPQAFEARQGRQGDLLGFLLAARAEEQKSNLADLSPEDRLALVELGDFTTASGSSGRRGLAGVRRRMVYRSRRPNLIYPPPEEAVAAITARQQAKMEAAAGAAARQAETDSLRAAGLLPADSPASGSPPTGVVDEFGRKKVQPLAADQMSEAETKAREAAAAALADSAAGAPGEVDPGEESEEPAKKKKKQDENWDFLR